MPMLRELHEMDEAIVGDEHATFERSLSQRSEKDQETRDSAASSGSVRTFSTGANRSSDIGKFDMEGFLAPAVLEAFGAYMHKHRSLPDGSTRASDNWQAGIPLAQYMKSLVRHVIHLWSLHRGHVPAAVTQEFSVPGLGIDNLDHVKLDMACAILFNTQGYMLELLKSQKQGEGDR